VPLRALLLSLALVLLGCASAPPRPAVIPRGDYTYARADLAWTIQREIQKRGIPGISIAVVDDQSVVLAEGFGLADVARGIPATAETLYRIGSIGKLFTGLEVARLAEAGRIDLDGALTTYLPGFGLRSRFGAGAPVTPRALLAHHSGLPRDLYGGMWVDAPHTLAQLLDDLREESLVAPTGTRYRYSNVDFAVLGRLIEVAAGRPYAEVLRDDVLLPLGMARSSILPRPGTARETAKGYRPDGSVAPPMGLRDLSAGAMLSSANDMARFLQVIFAGGRAGGTRVLGEAALQAMLTPQYPGLARDFGHEMGLAFVLGKHAATGKRLAWHGGNYPPFYAHLVFLPDERIGVVVLTNSARASGAASAIAEQALDLALEAKLGVTLPPPPVPAARPAYHADPAAVARWAGRYMVLGELAEVVQRGDRLRAPLLGTKVDLVPIGPDRFALEARPLLGLLRLPLDQLTLEMTEVDARPAAILRGARLPRVFERVDPTPIPAAWRARLGTWEALPTRGASYAIIRLHLREDAGLLVADQTTRFTAESDQPEVGTVALRAVSDSEAVVAGLEDDEGGTVRALAEGGGEVLRYSGFRFRRR
jgi:CubicO group peptidase (beta-lactamase class C family)